MRQLSFSPFLSCRIGTDAKGIKQLRSALFFDLPEDRFVLFNAANLIDEVRELPVGSELFVFLTKGRFFIKDTSFDSFKTKINHWEKSGAGSMKPDWVHIYYFKRTPKCFIFKGIDAD